MEFTLNEVGQPVIYVITNVHVGQSMPQGSFETATVTLEEAESIIGNRPGFEIIEQNMLTREQCPVSLIRQQQEQKDLLVGLYKSGFKRKTFEELDVRKPFQKQLNFPIAPELTKAEAKAAKTTALVW